MTTDQPGRARDTGFSFIELLAYMAIAALLILAAVPQFNAYRAKARDAATMQDVRNVAASYEAFSIDHPGEMFPFVQVEWAGTSDAAQLRSLGIVVTKGTRIWVQDHADRIGGQVPTTLAPGEEFCIFATNNAGGKWNGTGSDSRLSYASRSGFADCRLDG